MIDSFKEKLETYFQDFFSIISTDKGDWTVKGFIDIYKNIYTISLDTKVISKIIELMIFPVILKFSNENDYEMVLSSHQDHYPDITFIDKKTKRKIALDLKSTYRINSKKVNGMTLGAFTGYFRNRTSNKNITFPYCEYSKHYILGIIYTKAELHNIEEKLAIELKITLSDNQRKKLLQYISNSTEENIQDFYKSLKMYSESKSIKSIINSCLIDEKKKYKIENLHSILSVIRDFDFFLQEKWKIAIDRPGSGNTKNIGSTNIINDLKNGTALFTKLKNGEEIFNDYWMYYLTNDMSKAIDLKKPPYTNIKSYKEYKGLI